jgi:ABC-type glycerol-3-phosphate transport system permease component
MISVFRGARPVSHAALAALALLGALPIWWMLVSSLRAPADLFAVDLFPAHPTLANYRAVLAAIPMLRMLANTVVVASAVTLFQLLTALFAAYAFGRWRFPGRGLLYGAIALTWLVPFQVTMIPNYVLLAHWGLLDSLAALVIPHIASAFAVMLLTQAVRSFPRPLIEAALLDGAGEIAVLFRVVVPKLRAAIASLAILLFIGAWNDYLWPLLITRRPENAVVQIGLQMFMTAEGNLWGPLMAASTMACLPILGIYAVLHRQVIESFTRSGLRG